MLEEERRVQDVRIYLGKARLHLDRIQPDLARGALRSAESLLDEDSEFARRERCVLQGRLDLIDGRFQDAYRRLRAYLLPPMKKLRKLYRKERSAWLQQDAESFVILAVAARETGHNALARVATDEAERRGARMDALELF